MNYMVFCIGRRPLCACVCVCRQWDAWKCVTGLHVPATKRLSYWQPSCHRLLLRLSFWHLWVQSVAKRLSVWQPLGFRDFMWECSPVGTHWNCLGGWLSVRMIHISRSRSDWGQWGWVMRPRSFQAPCWSGELWELEWFTSCLVGLSVDWGIFSTLSHGLIQIVFGLGSGVKVTKLIHFSCFSLLSKHVLHVTHLYHIW